MRYLTIIIIASNSFFIGFILGFAVGSSMHIAHGAQNTTVSVPIPIQVPILQYSPTPLATPQVQQPTQQPQGNIMDAVIPIIVALAGIIAGKIHSDKKITEVKDITKENMGAILQSKEVQKELARIMFAMNPEKANAINDAPAIKMENLQQDVKDFSEKAAKA